MNRMLRVTVNLLMVIFFTSPVWGQDTGLMPVPVFAETGRQAVGTYDSLTGFYTHSYTGTDEVLDINNNISQQHGGVTLISANLTTSHPQQETGDSVFTIDISVGAERATTGKHGWTMLMESALKGDTATVNVLLAKGVDVDAKDDGGTTALMVAAYYGHIDIVHLLINSGADVNIKDENGITALSEAVKSGHTIITQALLDNGADPNVKLFRGRSLLGSASMKGLTEIVKALLNAGADVNSKEQNNNTALILATGQGHEGIVKTLLANRADVNAKGYRGRTALEVASERGKTAIVRTLLDKGADISRYGGEALISAVRKGHSAVVQVLLARSVDVNSKDKYGNTTLILAAQQGDEDTARILLENGADVNMKNDQGQTALIYADYKGHKSITQALLAKVSIKKDATSLIFFQHEKNRCDLKMWNPINQATKLLHSLKECPKDVFVDEDTDTVFVLTESIIQEIVFRPGVIIKPPVELPFKKGMVEVEGEKRWNSLYRVGYLKDGRLAVVNNRMRPADDSDMFLYALDKNKWTLVDHTYCGRYGDCTLGPISGRRWRAWRRESRMWHPMLSMNPFVVDRGKVRNTGRQLHTKMGNEHWRYIKLFMSGHQSNLYHYSMEGEHSFGLYTFSIYLKTYKDEVPVELSDGQCNTAIEYKYLLLDRYFGKGIALVDLETGENLIEGLEFAFWVY